MRRERLFFYKKKTFFCGKENEGRLDSGGKVFPSSRGVFFFSKPPYDIRLTKKTKKEQ